MVQSIIERINSTIAFIYLLNENKLPQKSTKNRTDAVKGPEQIPLLINSILAYYKQNVMSILGAHLLYFIINSPNKHVKKLTAPPKMLKYCCLFSLW